MENKVLTFWQSQRFPQGAVVYCAVSGGADSMALLHVLLSVKDALSITVRAAHFNHRLRGAESERDARFVRDFCEKCGVDCIVGSADIAAIAAKRGESIEECARRERYAFFDSLDGFVATAHTEEDNLETVLLNLVRGTALKGLCGIPARRGRYLRPMLCATHAEIRDYLQEHGIDHVEDSTNAEKNCVRNRLRLDVLPLLQRENPALYPSVMQTCQALRKDEDFLQSLADKALADAKRGRGYDCETLRAQKEPIRFRALRSILSDVRKLTRRHLQACDDLLMGDAPSASVCLPDGLRLRREYGKLILENSEPERSFAPVPLPLGEAVYLPLQKLCITTQTVTVCESTPNTETQFAVRADIDSLVIRPRTEHDAIRLRGGTRSLKKLFIDRKIPQPERALVPVIADREGVLFVYGIGKNSDRTVNCGQSAVLITIKEVEAHD